MLDTKLPDEFARVVACTRCSLAHSSKVLRDAGENVPQPGYVGSRYADSRVLLAGQNPGVCPPRFAATDAEYTRALRGVRDQQNEHTFGVLRTVLERFVPTWPIHGTYFPLEECGLNLEQIAYCNVVRCRTLGNATPNDSLARECVSAHFERWLSFLNPVVVVFLGKWASRQASAATHRRGMPSAYISPNRSLNGEQRADNRQQVVALVCSTRAAAQHL